MSPQRIQRKRAKGWKMPSGAVYVGRPTIFGNPFKTADEFRRWLRGELRSNGVAGGLRRVTLLARLKELHGKDLMCWCRADKPCHADVLLEIVNR